MQNNGLYACRFRNRLINLFVYDLYERLFIVYYVLLFIVRNYPPRIHIYSAFASFENSTHILNQKTQIKDIVIASRNSVSMFNKKEVPYGS